MNTQKIKASSILVVVVLLLSLFVPTVQAESNCPHAKQEPFYLANSESVVPLNASEHEVARYCWIRCADCGDYLDYHNETEVVPHELTSFEWEGQTYVTCDACGYKAKQQAEYFSTTNLPHQFGADEEYTPAPVEVPTATPAPTMMPTTKAEPVLLDGIYASNDFQFRLFDNGDAIIVKYTGKEEHVVFPSEIKMPGVTYPVKAIGITYIPGEGMIPIGDYTVFTDENYAYIEEIVIEEGVETIGFWAFCGCSYLSQITMPDSVKIISAYAFSNCESLTSVTIPDRVTSIGEGAFNACSALTRIVLPDSVTSIGANPFANCDGLTNLQLSPGHPVLEIRDGVLIDKKENRLVCYLKAREAESCVVPEGISLIGEYAFYDCDSLKSITLPDGVTSISEYAFCDCDSLNNIILPDSVISIGESAFSDCRSLIYIVIPNNVASIGAFAFSNCDSMTTVTLLDGVTTIGKCAFKNCLSLSSITIPNSMTSIGENAFVCCYSLNSISLPDSVTSIGEAAFGINCVIMCSPNSYAYQYAKENDIKVSLGEPVAITVTYHSLLDINKTTYTETIFCERNAETIITANKQVLPYNHEFVGTTQVTIAVDEAGNVSHDRVMFIYQESTTPTPKPTPTATPTPTSTPIPEAQRIKPRSSSSKYEGRGTKFDRYYGEVSNINDMLDNDLNTRFGWLIEMSQYQGDQVQFTFSFSGEDITAIRIRNGNLKNQNSYYKYARLTTLKLKIYYNGTWDIETVHIPDVYSTEYFEHTMSRKYTNVDRIEVMHDQEGRVAGNDRDRKYSCYITDIMFMGY